MSEAKVIGYGIAVLALLGLGAWGYRRLATPKKKPAEYDEDRLRREAVDDANRIDDQQIRDMQAAERERRGQAQARADLAAAAARRRDEEILAAQGGRPIPEVIKRGDTIGYYRAGKFVTVEPGERVIGPNGAAGSFDPDGRFIPEAAPEAS